MYGYRFGDAFHPALPEQVTPCVIKLNSLFDEINMRVPMKVSLGCHLMGAALPKPDTRDSRTALAGSLKRMVNKTPSPNMEKLDKLSQFARNWLEENMVPLDINGDYSFENWISERPYPSARKTDLRKTYESVRGRQPRKDVKSFVKDESYPDYKFSRSINSRHDEFKVLIGPYVAAIEKVMYENPSFIKHVPVPERPDYILRHLFPAEFVSTTDYTSFEASFVEAVMVALDEVMFEFFFRDVKCQDTELYKELKGENVCQFKWYTMYLKARRMSGEMNTSLSNGFANLMVGLFLAQELELGDVRMIVEGDDGLMTTSTGKYPTPADYAELGFIIKLEVCKKEHASFCGILYDLDDKANVTDPREVLAEFGWASQRYARYSRRKLMALLRSKSLSYLYQYPGCPIIQELALYGLRMTRSYNVKHFIKEDPHISMYEREMLLKMLESKGKVVEVGYNTRLLVEQKFGITIADQIRIEEMLRLKDDLSPIDSGLDFPVVWTHYYAAYHAKNYAEDASWFVETASVPYVRGVTFKE